MACISHTRVLIIQIFHNIIYSHLNNPRPNVISDKWKHNKMQDWEFLAKNFDSVSNELIVDEDLSRLDIYISAPGYLEEERPHFIKVIEDINEEPD